MRWFPNKSIPLKMNNEEKEHNGKAMDVNTSTLLSEAKLFLMENRNVASLCPCCGSLVKVYKRTINKSQAEELIKLYVISRDQPGYHHHSRFKLPQGGEISKLRHWGLVEQKPKDDTDAGGKTSGYWKITDLGKAYVEKREALHRYALFYMGRFIGFEGFKEGIGDVLEFNYDELMNRK